MTLRAAARLLGSSVLVDVDTRHGVNPTAVTWTDHLSTRVLTGVNAPTFGTDLGYFNNRPVWKFAAASSQYLDSGAGGATLFALGAGALYVSMVLRVPLLTDLGAGQTFLNLSDNALTDIQVQIARTAGATATIYGRIAGQNANTAIDIGTTPRLVEVFLDAAGQRYISIDGVDVTDAPGGGVTTTTIMQRIFVGAFAGPAAPSNVNVARLRICTAVPSLSVRTSLRQIDHLVWGTAR